MWEKAVAELLSLPIDGWLALVVLAVSVAGFLRGFVGFGAALVTVPVLSLVIGPQLAVAVSTFMGLPAIFQLLPEAIRRAERPIVIPIGITAFLLTPVGTWLLVVADPAVMKIVISLMVLGMVAMLASGWRLKGHIGMGKLITAGVAGGLVQGAAGIGGPPVVAVALSRPGDPTQLRGTVLGLMTAVALSSVPPLLYYGLVTRQALIYSVVLFPIYSLGTAVGSRYFAQGGQKHYRQAAMGVLMVVAVVTLVLSVRSYFWR